MGIIMLLNEIFPSGFGNELRLLSKLALPLFITEILHTTPGLIALVFCGYLGSTEQAGVGLSLCLASVTGINITMGLSTACETLFAQTFGSVNKHRLGIVLQRAVIIIILCLMPCCALHLNTEIFLLAIGEDPRAAQISGDYMLIMIPGLAAFGLYVVISKYIQCQDTVVPNLVIGGIANVMCGIMHYVLIFYWELGTNGSAWAMTSGNTLFCRASVYFRT